MKPVTFSATAHLTRRWQPDRIIIGCALGLCCFGLVAVASASMPISDRDFNQPLMLFWRQLIFAGTGILCACAAFQIPTGVWPHWRMVILVSAFFLGIIVLIPSIGISVNGSRRWIDLMFLRLQASELIRLLLIVYLSAYVDKYHELLPSNRMAFFKPVFILILAATLFLMQPDLGAAVLLITTGILMLFVAGAPLSRCLSFGAAGIAAIAVLIVKTPYRFERLMVFLDPWQDPFDSGYQLIQSMVAIGSGGLSGLGLGQSMQKLFYLPEAHTDFIFSIIAEEMGLFGATFLILCFLLLLSRGLTIARMASERSWAFGAALAYGISISLGLQAFINIAMTMGLLPTKGLALPFISYGGSSLIMTWLMIGLLLRVHKECVDEY